VSDAADADDDVASNSGQALRTGLRGLVQDAAQGALPPFRSGLVRLTVAVPRTVDALEWLGNLPRDDPALLPMYYLSPRTPPPAVRSGNGDDAAKHVTNDTNENGAEDKHAEPPEWRADPRGAVGAAGGACVWTGSERFGAEQLKAMRQGLMDSARHVIRCRLTHARRHMMSIDSRHEGSKCVR
jgi:isochorismate synthase/2-succinyl-5-enolpyruvyl-6-hydroxy-3-cyclohexene-1-carboxylate synthase/2-succinyl-6-hydroxy-2,4-cyclohexadiene-1-carboxylate synthase/O-succinylbenzoate synthase